MKIRIWVGNMAGVMCLAAALCVAGCGHFKAVSPMEQDMLYAVAGGHLAQVQELNKQGANLEAADAQGRRALHVAALGGHQELAAWLVKQKVALNPRDREGNTPLHLAAQAGHVQFCRWLIASGGDPTLKNNQKLTPHELALRGGHEETAAACLYQSSSNYTLLPGE
jgi:ankyrin repeat protein